MLIKPSTLIANNRITNSMRLVKTVAREVLKLSPKLFASLVTLFITALQELLFNVCFLLHLLFRKTLLCKQLPEFVSIIKSNGKS
jgi:hypothetical protein